MLYQTVCGRVRKRGKNVWNKYAPIVYVILFCYHHSRDMEKSRGCVSNFPEYPNPRLV